MLKSLSFFVFATLLSLSCWSQNVSSSHDVKAGSLPNEFIVKTTISGLEGADLARIKYFLSKEHTYKKSSNNGFFSKEEEEYVKFYIMSIPANGVVEIELGIILSGSGNFEFPIEFQYSKNEEKIVIDCVPLKIDNGTALVAEDSSLKEDEQTEKNETELAEVKAEEEKSKKAAEELAAKNKADEAALVLIAATMVKKDADDQAKKEQEKIEQQKAEEERLEKLAEEEKSKKVAEELATKNKADEAALALIAATKVKQDADEQAKEEQLRIEKEKIEKQKAEEEAKALVLEEQQRKEEVAQEVAQEKIALAAKEKEAEKSVVESTNSSSNEGQYGVQIFALSKYTEQKVRDFCKRNSIDYSEISTFKIKGITKVRYGSVNTKAEAEILKKELLSKPQINGGFVVKL